MSGEVPGTEAMMVPPAAQRPIGQSGSTEDGYKSALKVINYFLTKILRYPPIRDLTERHIEEDNLQNLLLKIALWMAHTPIPKYSDENLESTTDPPKYVIVSTLTEYLSKGKEAIKKSSPSMKIGKMNVGGLT